MIVAVMIAFFTITATAINSIRNQIIELQTELTEIKTTVSYIDDLCCSELKGGDAHGAISNGNSGNVWTRPED